MITNAELEYQLRTAGVRRTLLIHAEIKELHNVLVPGEQIQYCLSGRYEGGFAMLCATDQRILLIDKKPLYLTMEDIRYDMVSEVDFSSRLIDSNVRICTVNKDLRFRSFDGATLRKMTAYMQHRIMEFRQQHMMQQQEDHQQMAPQAVPAAPASQPVLNNVAATTATAITAPVKSLQHNVINPYLRAPLMMRRRVSRFPVV